MSQNPKRPGSRDISELKARLGLKKGAAAGGAAQPKQRNGAGVVPPPGLNLPPPPGVKPAVAAPGAPTPREVGAHGLRSARA